MQQSTKTSLRVTLAYILFASAWILYSDMAVEAMFQDPSTITRMQTYKGFFFILLTSTLLFVLAFKNYQRLEKVFQLDGLTGLLNHHLLKVQIDQRLSALGEDEKLVIGCLDINNFKELNETIGYDAADQFILQLSEAFQQFARPGSIMGRLPPDQFAVAREYSVTENIYERVQGYLNLFIKTAKQANVEATCRIGFAIYPDDGATAKELLAAATAATVKAKNTGQTVCYHDKILSEESTRRRKMLKELKSAIDNNQLKLVYQPKYILGSNDICGAEVLIRWTHPVHGFIAPDEFIPLAEANGLMTPITQFVLSQAEKELDQIGLLNGTLKHISVNVSAAEFNEMDDMISLQHYIRGLKKLSNYIRLEITETATLKDFEQSRSIIDALRDDGIGISIDDFGTGYTSLAMLKDFPIDEIKIDRSFVSGMVNGGRSKTIVEAVIAMAQSFDINVVAEGVETEEQLMHLEELGCKEAQGFYLGAPMSAGNFKNHLMKHDQQGRERSGDSVPIH